MAEKKIDIVSVLNDAIKSCENNVIFNQGKASAFKELNEFLKGKNVVITEHIEEPKKKE